jgi:cytochrome c-type biogenesis protein CcmH
VIKLGLTGKFSAKPLPPPPDLPHEGGGIWPALTALIVLIFLSSFAHAVQPDEVLPDAAMEARARTISQNMRCLVCQNQSIDDSEADLARDLRLLVRERLKAGDSDEQVEHYIVSRYGDYVLLKPPFKPETYVLWLGPAILFLAALAAVFLFYRNKKSL